MSTPTLTDHATFNWSSIDPERDAVGASSCGDHGSPYIYILKGFRVNSNRYERIEVTATDAY